MRYIFFGTPRFAEIVLDALLKAGMPPLAVVCNPDRPVGRKKIITAPETKRRILDAAHGNLNVIEILQPEKIDDTLIKQLKDLRPDFFIVAAYAKIIPKTALEIPRLGTIGVHPSLLPKYRGTSPIQSAILGGEKETGVTIYLMDEKIDHGEIISQTKYQISTADNYEVLVEELGALSGKLLVEILPKFVNGEIKSLAQEEQAATLTKKFKTEDGYVTPEDLKDAQAGDPEKTETIFRKIRAMNPEPGIWTINNGKRIKLLKANIVDGSLRLMRIQEEGQKPKDISDGTILINGK